jgi:hypothetical protein
MVTFWRPAQECVAASGERRPIEYGKCAIGQLCRPRSALALALAAGRSIWQYDTVEICVSSALSRSEADHEHSAIANSIRGCVRRIDISLLRGNMFSGHRPLGGSMER